MKLQKQNGKAWITKDLDSPKAWKLKYREYSDLSLKICTKGTIWNKCGHNKLSLHFEMFINWVIWYLMPMTL